MILRFEYKVSQMEPKGIKNVNILRKYRRGQGLKIKKRPNLNFGSPERGGLYFVKNVWIIEYSQTLSKKEFSHLQCNMPKIPHFSNFLPKNVILRVLLFLCPWNGPTHNCWSPLGGALVITIVGAAFQLGRERPWFSQLGLYSYKPDYR